MATFMGIRYHNQIKIDSVNDDYIFYLLVRFQIDILILSDILLNIFFPKRSKI